MADGTGVTNRDEHLVPGRGAQPCASLLRKLAAGGYSGTVVLEVNTRRALSHEARLADLAEALEFTRRHLGGPALAGGGHDSGRQSQAGDGRRRAGDRHDLDGGERDQASDGRDQASDRRDHAGDGRARAGGGGRAAPGAAGTGTARMGAAGPAPVGPLGSVLPASR